MQPVGLISKHVVFISQNQKEVGDSFFAQARLRHIVFSKKKEGGGRERESKKNMKKWVKGKRYLNLQYRNKKVTGMYIWYGAKKRLQCISSSTKRCYTDCLLMNIGCLT